jgi:primosomal protein N' (replication factor Y) (superfamily II helicase)
MVKGKLTLRRELVSLPPVPPSGEFTVAHLWVDASVYHLDTPFSYLIPGNLADSINVGSLVLVPFHGREITALVIEIVASESTTGLKSISKVLGSLPLMTQEIINLIGEASKRYAAHPFDLIRSAIPDRVIGVEREFLNEQSSYKVEKGKSQRHFIQLPPHLDRSHLMARKIAEQSKSGGVLVVLPDTHEVSRLSKELALLNLDFVVVESKLPKSDQYRNFLKARIGQVRIVIGTRSAVFTPVSDLRTLMIYNEGSEHLYERRSPGWNARDIALLRNREQDFNLIFVGYSPSSEVARLIDAGWIEYKRSRGKMKVSTYSSEHGELLPSRAIPIIKKSLAIAPVLCIVPLKGYAQAIRCGLCKTISRCVCGGAHEKLTLSAPITCNHCLEKVTQWKCSWCHSERLSMQSRGADRHQHELGLLFPGVTSVISTADHPVDSYAGSGIVLATPGMAPFREGGYSAVLFLEGNRFLNQPDMRANERVREMFFSHASLVAPGGLILLIQDEGHHISTALTTWNPSMAIHRELEERQSLSLPPYVRAVKLLMDPSDISRLQSALTSAREEGRIPGETKILGPITIGDKSSLILTVPLEVGEKLISTLHEFMRRRSVGKKSLPSLRIDPYSLSH